MTTLTTLDGTVLHVDDNSITMVAGPYPGEPAERSHVTGPGPAPIATHEAAATLVARLQRKQALAMLTRPNRTPVWIDGGAVSLVRPPAADDVPPGETVGAVLFVGSHHQAVEESVAAARAIINAHGGNV